MNSYNFNPFRGLRARLTNDKYYDFQLVPACVCDSSRSGNGECPAAEIDLDNPECLSSDTLLLYSSLSWDDAVNNGVELRNIGIVGMDNGTIRYRKDRITNSEFLDLVTASTLTVASGDTRLVLRQVTGNTGDYSYPSSAVTEEGRSYLKLQGGFYQGFFKLDGHGYQTLPDALKSEWRMTVELRPQDYELGIDTLNRTHDDTDGFFLYVGTRAENKFALLYDDTTPKEVNPRLSYADYFGNKPSVYADSGYSCGYYQTEDEEDYMGKGDGSQVLDSPYLGEDKEPEPTPLPEYVTREYLHKFPGQGECPPPTWEYAKGYLDPEHDIDSSIGCVDTDEESGQTSGSTSGSPCGCEIPLDAWLGDYRGGAGMNTSKPDNNQTSCRPEIDKDDCGCDIDWETTPPEDEYVSAYAPCDLGVVSAVTACGQSRETPSGSTSGCGCSVPFEAWLGDSPSIAGLVPNPPESGDTGVSIDPSCPGQKLLGYWGGYVDTGDFSCGREYVEDGYVGQDISLSGVTVETAEGYPLDMANIEEFSSDNKFLLFNRTPTGYTVHTYSGETVTFSGRTTGVFKENLFLLMNRTETGHTVHDIQEYIDSKSNGYDMNNDLYYNGIGFRVRSDGSVGYRYLVMDCSGSAATPSVIEEYGRPGVVKKGEWSSVEVRLRPLGDGGKACATGAPKPGTMMRVEMLVDGNLALVGKEIPILHLKALSDIAEKQEGVPYNLSLGGGSQGLCDMVTIDYYSLPLYRLPVEKHFAGTFVGDIRVFRFSACGTQAS